MSFSILITQCLQRDFIDLVAPHEPLPNKLHVGREEAQRLLGPDPSAGPVSQLLSWARAQKQDELAIIHIRDWHDPSDARQHDHLAQFGNHCLRGTPGAKLVLGMDDEPRPNELLVDAIALNDFEDTSLQPRLKELLARAKGERVRIGVVGVWTEAKVSFLLYDLKTRVGADSLATCSALTASASRSQHFNALDQLQKILGVQVFDGVGDFTEWMLPNGARPALPKAAHGVFGPGLAVDGGALEIGDDDRDILGFLYRDSAKVELHPLSGGFSGAAVWRVTSRDAMGHEQAPSVAKLGPRNLIAAERTAFERVENVLGNHAPSVKGFVDFGERAGIKYAFASMGGSVTTLKGMFDHGVAQEKIDDVLHGVFDDILGHLYAAAQYERMPLLEHYCFESRFEEGVRDNVKKIVGPAMANAPQIEIRGHAAKNVADFYGTFLKDRPIEPGEYHFVSYVHGDLNGANILVDGRENVWIIDFFHTGRGHVLKDLAKLENDLLYIYTKVESDADLDEALSITRALRSVQDLAAPLPERIGGVTSAPFLRAWATLRTLRGIVAKLCRSDRDPQQLRIALLRYSVHTLSFDESSPLQKKWALAASCALAEDVMEATRRNRRLRIDWIDTPILPWAEHGRFGLTLLPGRRDRGRSLSEDLDELRRNEVTRLVSLVTEDELSWAGVPTLRADAESRGIQVMRLPIRDQSIPSFAEAENAVRWILAGVTAKENVVLHCMGGLGRTGTIAACVLVARGATADEAIASVRKARGPRAIEIAEQERFVRDYAREREQQRMQAGP